MNKYTATLHASFFVHHFQHIHTHAHTHAHTHTHTHTHHTHTHTEHRNEGMGRAVITALYSHAMLNE